MMDSSSIPNRPRKAWLAFLLGLFLPGLGQLYNGQINRAAWFMLGSWLFGIPLVGLFAPYLPDDWTAMIMLGSIGLALLIWLISCVDALLQALKRSTYVPASWQGAGTYLFLILLVTVCLFPLLSQQVRKHWIEPFRIPSASMEPALIAGDFIYADKHYNCLGCEPAIQRGDIITFTYPNNRSMGYIKRVIGLPGDQIKIRGQTVTVNNKPLTVQSAQQEGSIIVQERYENKQWPVIWKNPRAVLPLADLTVPAGQVFVLGDNRSNSNDSRYFGAVPLADVTGRARQVWFSYNRDVGGLQWARVGLVLH